MVEYHPKKERSMFDSGGNIFLESPSRGRPEFESRTYTYDNVICLGGEREAAKLQCAPLCMLMSLKRCVSSAHGRLAIFRVDYWKGFIFHTVYCTQNRSS
jgi:hypothetical protein